ncbi:hypothetical protein AB0M28_36990 [Streptomyces sp. NPDC051940]|uniref:hypothetical protein n=1 Tax=Streptomyces sp. NPDC051940 TaxID=3155675 RepID=UPI0034416C58
MSVLHVEGTEVLFAWQTADFRSCWGQAGQSGPGIAQGCLTRPLPPTGKPRLTRVTHGSLDVEVSGTEGRRTETLDLGEPSDSSPFVCR